MKKWILFDFDFTLVDASVGIIIGTYAALNQMGKALPTEDEVRHTIGLPLEKMYTQFTGSDVLEEQKEFRAFYVKAADGVLTENTHFFIDAIEVLKALKSHDFYVGIVSTKNRSRIEEVLVRDDLTPLVDVVVGGEDVKQHKPNPEGINLVINKYALNREDLIFVGDTVIDQGAAQNAGVDFIAVLNGTTTREDFIQNGLPSESICNTLTDALERILGEASGKLIRCTVSVESQS